VSFPIKNCHVQLRTVCLPEGNFGSADLLNLILDQVNRFSEDFRSEKLVKDTTVDCLFENKYPHDATMTFCEGGSFFVSAIHCRFPIEVRLSQVMNKSSEISYLSNHDISYDNIRGKRRFQVILGKPSSHGMTREIGPMGSNGPQWKTLKKTYENCQHFMMGIPWLYHDYIFIKQVVGWHDDHTLYTPTNPM
jgi:hypothetical protein